MLSIPLAFAGLPVYVHVPHYYATSHQVSLVEISLALLIIRFIDAFQDPLIGMASDRLSRYRKRIIALASLCLMAGFVGLFNVPSTLPPVYWMAGMLLIVYTAFSTVMINYYAAGLPLADNPAGHRRISAYREGALLCGVMLAAVLPQYLSEQYDDITAYRIFAFCFIPIALLCMISALRIISNQGQSTDTKHSGSIRALLRESNLRRIYLLFFINAIPTAITSTLFLFFVEDVLATQDHAGIMLMAYFLCAALSVALWTKWANRYGTLPILRLGMALAIASFIWAYSLGAGDIMPFYIICALSGFALGADVTLLPALFATQIERHPEQASVGFSLWHFLGKLNLSLAAGIVLPLLAFSGYQPADTASNLHAVSAAYALIPCAFKVIAFCMTYAIHHKESAHDITAT